MKKMIFVMAAFSLLAFSLVSCGKDDTTDTTDTTVTPGGNTDPTTDPNYIPDGFVDLGLPSRLLWATCNLGATAPEQYGDYYAWGETASKEIYTWATYVHCSGTSSEDMGALLKYNTNGVYGAVDEKKTLESSDDAATAVLGAGNRMPSQEDWQELLSQTTSEWTTVNDVRGRKFTSRTNGNTMFLPAAGYYGETVLSAVGDFGGYWSSSLYVDRPDGALFFRVTSSTADLTNRNRYFGQTVRAVRPRQ